MIVEKNTIDVWFARLHGTNETTIAVNWRSEGKRVGDQHYVPVREYFIILGGGACGARNVAFPN